MVDDIVADGCLVVIWIALEDGARAMFRALAHTGDFIVDLLTLEVFRRHRDDEPEGDEKDLLPDWLAALVGFAFWATVIGAMIWSWPLLSAL